MANIPSTSITMLKAISGDASSVRWTEFFRKYEGPMRGFLHARYPAVEADDAIQETMVALVKALPDYHYTPDGSGHFRNYLMGILGHKAADILRKGKRQASLRDGLRNERRSGLRMSRAVSPESACGYGDVVRREDPGEDESWKTSAMEAAVEQLMSDDGIMPTTREVFRHVALMHESPDDVAAQFGISRNNVDQIKKRMIGRLAKMVAAMTEGFTTP